MLENIRNLWLELEQHNPQNKKLIKKEIQKLFFYSLLLSKTQNWLSSVHGWYFYFFSNRIRNKSIFFGHTKSCILKQICSEWIFMYFHRFFCTLCHSQILSKLLSLKNVLKINIFKIIRFLVSVFFGSVGNIPSTPSPWFWILLLNIKRTRYLK